MKPLWMRIWMTVLMSFGLCLGVIAQDEKGSDEQAGHPDPKQLKMTKWTPDFQVPNPVAISFDPEGVAYVTETRRRKANDLDIRPNSDWIPDDLGFQSTEDKMNFYREQFTPENSEANKRRVKDYNGDGIHDIRDLTVLSERIHKIADEDGDGIADTIYTYAEELDHLIGGVAGGVLYHDGAVYTCPVPELVKFTDTNGDGAADEKEVMVSGFGVHLAYAGHDMHGLTMGVDGRIYWSVGDKGIRVKTKDGLDFRFPNQGGLMRCELDGTNFEVFAHGQRNIQEVAFDQFGNFFGVDNDADYPGERERLVFIEQYLDTGWRNNWQYLREGYNPWTYDLMHEPWQENQPRWFTPPLSNYENGPAGFKFNPGTALGPDYQDYFFLTSAPRGEQWAFQVKASGDSFAMVNDHKIGEGVPLVGLNFSPDGGLYGVDWGGGYPLNEIGAVWRIDVDEDNFSPYRKETGELIAMDFSDLEMGRLVELLAWPDQRVRLKAQYALAGCCGLTELEMVTRDLDQPLLARLHALWGIGQIVRVGKAPETSLTALFDDPDAEVRAQAIKTVTDGYGRYLGLDIIPGPSGETHSLTAVLIEKLKDESLRVRQQALLGLGRMQDELAAEAILEEAARESYDVGKIYTRHACVMAMAGSVPSDQLVSLKDHDSDFVRACAVVALRRRGDAGVVAFFDDQDPITAADAARAVHDDWMIKEAMPQLAEALGKQIKSEGFTRRAINANFRIGDLASAKRVAAFVADGKASEELLEAGLVALEAWSGPGVLDLVIGRHRTLESRDSSVVAEAIGANIDALLSSNYSSVRAAAMKAAREAKLTIAPETLIALLENQAVSGTIRAEALRTLSAQGADGLEALLSDILGDKANEVRMAGLELLADLDAAAAMEEIRNRVTGDQPFSVKQHAIRLLPKVNGVEAMTKLIGGMTDGILAPELQLDVLEVSKDPAFAEVKAITKPVAELEASWVAAMTTDPVMPYRFALAGGNAKRGESVFMNHAAAQCIRCHKVDDKKGGSNVGPNLKSIGMQKDAEYILQALVDPQAVIAKGYGNISLTLKDGSTVAGVFRREDKKHVVIREVTNDEIKILVEKIAERSPVISTMPPMGYIVTKPELRDLVAYLQSLKAEKK